MVKGRSAGCCGNGRNQMARQAIFGGNQISQIGILAENDFSGDFTIFGAANITINSNSIDLIYSGNHTNFNNGLVYNEIVSASNGRKFIACFTLNDATEGGYCISTRDSSDNSPMTTLVYSSSSGLFGNGVLRLYSLATLGMTAIDGVPAISGHHYRLTLEIHNDRYSGFVEDITNETMPIISEVLNNYYEIAGGIGHQIAGNYKFGWATCGGNVRMTSFKLQSTQYKNANLLIVDSKGVGIGVSSFDNTYAQLLRVRFPNINIYIDGYGNMVSSQVNDRLTDLLTYCPKNVIVLFGCNDERYGKADIYTNLTALKLAFEAIGSKVIFAFSSPEVILNLIPFNTTASALFTYKIPEVFDNLYSGISWTPNPIYIDPDGIHLNDIAQPVMESVLQPYIN